MPKQAENKSVGQCDNYYSLSFLRRVMSQTIAPVVGMIHSTSASSHRWGKHAVAVADQSSSATSKLLLCGRNSRSKSLDCSISAFIGWPHLEWTDCIQKLRKYFAIAHHTFARISKRALNLRIALISDKSFDELDAAYFLVQNCWVSRICRICVSQWFTTKNDLTPKVNVVDLIETNNFIFQQ